MLRLSEDFPPLQGGDYESILDTVLVDDVAILGPYPRMPTF